MSGIYVYSDRPEVAASLLTLARTLGGGCTALAFQEADIAVLQQYGPDGVVLVEGALRPECFGKSLAAWLLDRKAELFLVGNTVRGRELAALVAGYAGAAMVSDAGGLSRDGGDFLADLTVYGGLVSRQERLPPLAVVTAGRGIAEAEQAPGGGAPERTALKPDSRVVCGAVRPLAKSGVDLGAASKVVGIGMGCLEEDVPAAQALAHLLGGELGCSRNVAEQKKWLPEERYIGISGAVLKPDLYLALGISGQIQHIFGVRDSKIIVAVNNNDKAPIFSYADYGIVGDAHTFIGLFTAVLKKYLQKEDL